MKKIIMLLLFVIISSNAYAVKTCSGKISHVLDWPTKCDGNIAFRLDSVSGIWICTTTPKSEAMILTAFGANKSVAVRLSTEKTSCSDIEQYHQPMYIYIVK